MIGPEDLNRLVYEITARFEAEHANNIEPISDWCKKVGISDEAIRYLSHILMHLWREAVAAEVAEGEPDDGDDVVFDNIEASILMAFTIGWEASREYGNKPA